eukprot:TRINITY_DN45752_c0_g1_i1.p1 TRINITY_DN45752_c0_g1~~TRINITY_DN45752_c0_g1_i1.p1  ORF type:complete len:303 (+),score=38.83 TRINITY_DN45752_c0_g1_i1:51-959(+)
MWTFFSRKLNAASVFALLVACSAVHSHVTIFGVEILEIDQLKPDTTIGHSVPTGTLSVRELEGLNLLVWARNVSRAAVSAVRLLSADPFMQLDFLITTVQSLIDQDFSAHACVLRNATTCDLHIGQSEDKNRYLDMVLHYKFDADVAGVRLLFAEDASKAVRINAPLSFNMVIDVLRVHDTIQRREYLGKNLAPADVGTALNAEGLDWATSGLVDLIVETTRAWPWQCSPRDSGNDFPTALMKAIVNFEAAVSGDWDVSFAESFEKCTGVAFKVEYTLCGHVMFIPIAIQSSICSASEPLVV